MQIWNQDMFRFANILKLTNISLDNIQKVVKIIKSETPLDLKCDVLSDALDNDVFLLQVKAVEEKLQIESTDQIIETLTMEDLKNAAEMFLYLNTCPKLWFKFWSSFYTDLFMTQPADQIILTLNRMMKPKVSKVQDGNIRADKLLKKITSNLSLRYKEIQRLTQQEKLKHIIGEHQSLNISDKGNITLDIFSD